MRRRTALLLAGLAAIGTCLLFGGTRPAEAQTYPARIVRLVVPQAAGGTTDILARHIAERLSVAWGQRVVVENIAGAAGNVGLQTVAKAAPDGYTLLMSDAGPLAVNQHVNRNIVVDPKEWQPISPVARSGFYIYVGKDSPFTTIAQLLEAGRSGRILNYSTSGAGSVNHIIGETLRVRSGAKLTHIAYRGIAPAIAGVMGGHVDLGVSSSPSLTGQLTGGDVRPLAISSEARSKMTPSVPTLKESGLDIALDTWWGVLGPANMDQDLVRKIADGLNTIASDPGFEAFLASLGAEPLRKSPKEFGEMLEADIKRWGGVVAMSGARIE